MLIKRLSRFFSTLLAIFTIVFSNNAYASDSGSGYPSLIYAQANGIILFSVTNHSNPWPGCATSVRYAINANTLAGQALYSTILTSLATKTVITVVGNGNCGLWGDSEDISYIRYNQ